nr:aldehyde dehydrogenase family protein [Actinomadura sp. BRA 177]
MAAHDGVDKIAFTGSTEVGRAIVRAAAGNLKRVSLELGGKSPNIVLDDADADAAIAGAALAIFYNQGEVCSAGSRLYVHESQFDRVVEGLAEHARCT